MTRHVSDGIELGIRHGMTRRGFLRTAGKAALGLAAVPILAACAGPRATGRPEVGGGAVVEMTDELRFVPDRLTIKVGDSVTWRNTGSIVHTTTDDPSKARDPANAVLPDGAEPWDSGDVAGGEEWSRTFDTPGEYTYFCIPHEMAGMVARVTVGEA